MEAISMTIHPFPVIDPAATGANITRLRRARGFTVRDLQRYFGFEEPQAIYKWQRGLSLPSVDNLYALSALLVVSMNEILVAFGPSNLDICDRSSRPVPAAPAVLWNCLGRGGHDRGLNLLRPLSVPS